MNLKRILAGALAVACVSSVNVFAADTTSKTGFSDVNESTAEGQAIVKMYEAGYIKGYEDGTFKPNGNITRAELTRVFNQVFGYKADEEKLKSVKNFADNNENDAWYYNDVRIAQSNGYINGFGDNTFRPKDNFTRQQTCVVLAQAAKLPTEVKDDIKITDEVSQWAESYVKRAISAGAFLLEKNETFRATDNITRGEVCLALAKYIGTNNSETSTEVTTKTEVVTNANGETVTETTTTDSTETTTKNTSSSGGGGGSSSGGSSSGGSSSTGTTSTTTTEATTETTTSGKTETTTSKVETTTETTTIATIELTAKEQKALKNIIRDTKSYLIPYCSTAEQKEVAQYILSAMEAYYADPSYDVLSDISTAKQMYYSLSADERKEFQSNCLSSLSLSDIETLKPIFEPFL
ncbi:MAG: S-layer homology domain-containing protein [Clostridia bacterium]|nr:S-layer homology domain-containing protein [Clostridia bacterium]